MDSYKIGISSIPKLIKNNQDEYKRVEQSSNVLQEIAITKEDETDIPNLNVEVKRISNHSRNDFYRKRKKASKLIERL